ncbi:MAG: hypothetical protein J0H01_36340 [Rhizobiales bacterium]|nr:hypothetical protein [Hyphomicrobiales bacterium]
MRDHIGRTFPVFRRLVDLRGSALRGSENFRSSCRIAIGSFVLGTSRIIAIKPDATA